MREPSTASSPLGLQAEQDLLPVSYTDGFVVSSVYLVSTKAARDCISSRNLHPIILTKDRSVVVLSLFDFRASSIGAYREVSLGVLVSPTASRFGNVMQLLQRSAVLGTWIVALPVTSELACRGGVQLFGYPKTLACIDMNRTTTSCSYVVRSQRDELLSVHVPLSTGIKVPIRQLVTYSALNGEMCKTVIPVRWSPKLCRSRGSQIRFTPGNALGDALGRLELPAEPTFVLHGSGFQGTLNVPGRLGPRGETV